MPFQVNQFVPLSSSVGGFMPDSNWTEAGPFDVDEDSMGVGVDPEGGRVV